MEPIQKCLRPLQVLIAKADANGIGLAERAVDDYLASFPPGPVQAGAFFLQQEVTALWQKSNGAQVEFANLVFDYIDNRFAGVK